MKILIVGATSAIAQAVARKFLTEKPEFIEFYLIARNENKLTQVADDLKARSAKRVFTLVNDLSNPSKMNEYISAAWTELSGIDVAFIAHGTLPDQRETEQNWQSISETLEENVLSQLAAMEALASKMQAVKGGIIAIIGSVAGDRGRQSNYIYGTAKGAISIYAQGLRNRLYKSNVHVLTIKPGFVDTPMTAAFEKKGALWATADQIAGPIVKAIKKRKNVIYTPTIWFVIMTIIKAIPEPIFKRLSL